MKILEIFGENRLEFIDKCKIIEIIDCRTKTNQLACITLHVGTKNEENFEKFHENFENF